MNFAITAALTVQFLVKNLIGYNSDIKYETSDYKKISINNDKYNISQSIKKILEKINLNN